MTTTADFYVRFSLQVRFWLARLGVRSADIEDASHEVFLVVHDKRDLVAAVEQPRLWINAICRRIAARYRRSASYHRELLTHEADLDGLVGAIDSTGPEDRRASEELRLLLGQLDEFSSDLVALYHLGPLSITEIAKFFEQDRKTVQKRLRAAERRLVALVQRNGRFGPQETDPGTRPTELEPSVMSAAVQRGRAAGCLVQELEVVAMTPSYSAGVVGNLLLVAWSTAITTVALEHLTRLYPAIAARCGGAFVYVAIMDRSAAPPALAARRAIARALDQAAPALQACVVCMPGGLLWWTEPVLKAALAVVRYPIPLHLFEQVEPMAKWLSQSCVSRPRGVVSPTEILLAVNRLCRPTPRE